MAKMCSNMAHRKLNTFSKPVFERDTSLNETLLNVYLYIYLLILNVIKKHNSTNPRQVNLEDKNMPN